MTDTNTNVTIETIENSSTTNSSINVSENDFVTLEEFTKLKANYHDAVAERDKTKSKLRNIEDDLKSINTIKKDFENLLLEKTELQQNYENLQIEVNFAKEAEKNRFIDSTLAEALTAAGARSIPTAIKLIDKSKLVFEEDNLLNTSVIDLIEELRTSDPILFGDSTPKQLESTHTPSGNPFLKIPVKLAEENNVQGAFEREIKNAKNNNEILAILKKYNKIQ